MPLPFTVRRTDPDAAAFCARSGATDRAAINAFVRGVKDLGLWENMVCWPLRSSQNAGTGTTAYSLGGLGTFDGTLTNGPTWGVDGVTFNNALAQYISTTLSFDASTMATGAATIVRPTDSYPIADSRDICGTRPTAEVGGSTFWFWKQISGIQSVSMFDSAAGHNGASSASSISTTFSNTWHFAGAFTDGITRQFFNQANDITATATSTGGSVNAGANQFQIGRGGIYTVARAFTGQIAAVTIVRRSTITAQDIDNLRTLYRTTLGTGLGLP
jgi:hypothetical protein